MRSKRENIFQWGIWAMVIGIGSSCVSVSPKGIFNTAQVPPIPDYHLETSWAALPQKIDSADALPANTGLVDAQDTSGVDVFYIYPTIYTGSRRYEKKWNAPIEEARVREKVDKSAVRFQASIFNGVGKVYAPYYRQMHIKGYFSKDRNSAHQAMELAWQDVSNAFEYYLKNYNKGRPIVIASHSQGTNHAERLLKTYFDQQPLAKQLVVAYLAGMPVKKNAFVSIPPCKKPEDLQCFCSWRTYKRGHIPAQLPVGDSILVTNPVTWYTDTVAATYQEHRGAVLPDFKKVYTQLVNPQVHPQGILWIDKPKFKGSFLYVTPNYHAGDLNLFYLDIRNNAKYRVDRFRRRESTW